MEGQKAVRVMMKKRHQTCLQTNILLAEFLKKKPPSANAASAAMNLCPVPAKKQEEVNSIVQHDDIVSI